MNSFFTGTVRNPLSRDNTILQCQADEIYNHNLGPECQARVDDLPYDYRITIPDSFHRIGPTFDRNGHFGAVRGCDGRVIH